MNEKMSQEQTTVISNNKVVPISNILTTKHMVQSISRQTPTPIAGQGPNKPILVKKENKIKLLHGESSSQLLRNLKLGPLYKESLIFESKPGSFIGNSPVKVSIVNRLDMLRNISKTIITYYDKLNGKQLSVKTSDRIARFIGQSNYETVLNAICSIKEEELKVNAVMALLTNEVVLDRSSQTDNEEPDLKPKLTEIKLEKQMVEKCCQTEENCMDLIFKFKERKRNKRVGLTPYVVKDPPRRVIKKCIINICKTKPGSKNDVETASTGIPELSQITGLSDCESDGNLSINESLCGDGILNVEPFYKNIDLHTATKQGTMMTVPNSYKHYINIPNDKQIEVSVKPEFPFHVATHEILKTLSNEDKVKLVHYQAFLDYKWCLERDSDGYLPIHNAVRNNDVDLLRRQCVVLRYRKEDVDIVDSSNGLTALQISIYHDTPQCTALLIQHGADPLLTNEEHRTCLHLASYSSLDNLRAVIKNCESNAREILKEHEELWKPEYETKTKEELAAILLKHMCEMHDSEGYTPLMLCAKSGNYSGVKALLEVSPECIDQPMPNSGCTALFLAVEGACHDAAICSMNKNKVADIFFQTISVLLLYGADNNITNHAGTSIYDLLTDSGNAELTTLFSNKVTCTKLFPNDTPIRFDEFILLKEDNGEISVEELKKTKFKGYNPRTTKMNPKIKKDTAIKSNEQNVKIAAIASGDKTLLKKEKPIILENIAIGQSPTKMFIDKQALIASPNIKIGPKDRLVTNRNKISNTKVIVSQTLSNIKLEPSSSVAGSLQEKAVCSSNIKKAEIRPQPLLKYTSSVIKKFSAESTSLAGLKRDDDVTKRNETNKRKSTNAPGPTEKKTKVSKTT